MGIPVHTGQSCFIHARSVKPTPRFNYKIMALHFEYIQLTMPPHSTKEALPALRPASSRKRKETSRFIENTDIPLPKKKKLKPAQTFREMSTHSRVETEDVDEDNGNNDSISPAVPVDGRDSDDETHPSSEDADDNKAQEEEDDEEAGEEESKESEMSKLVTIPPMSILKNCEIRVRPTLDKWKKTFERNLAGYATTNGRSTSIEPKSPMDMLRMVLIVCPTWTGFEQQFTEDK